MNGIWIFHGILCSYANTNILIPLECLLIEDKLYLTHMHSIVFRATSDTSKWLSLLFVWALGVFFCHFSLISEMRQFSTNLYPWSKISISCGQRSGVHVNVISSLWYCWQLSVTDMSAGSDGFGVIALFFTHWGFI